MDPAVQRHNATVEGRHWWFAARRKILRALAAELVPPSKDALVLDIGCGTGGNSGALADDYRVVGLDDSATAIELASERFPSARFVCGDVRTALEGCWDDARLVLLMDVIEHVEDDFELLSTVVAHTRPGCHYLVTVPADPELWSAHDVASRHWRRYTRPRLERVWRDLPVEPLLVTPCNAVLAPLVRAARALRRGKKPVHGSGADLAIPARPVNALLRWTFEREAGPLVRALRRRRHGVYRDGISLLAILRRTPGAATVLGKPPDVPPDEHRPD